MEGFPHALVAPITEGTRPRLLCSTGLLAGDVRSGLTGAYTGRSLSALAHPAYLPGHRVCVMKIISDHTARFSFCQSKVWDFPTFPVLNKEAPADTPRFLHSCANRPGCVKNLTLDIPGDFRYDSKVNL